MRATDPARLAQAMVGDAHAADSEVDAREEIHARIRDVRERGGAVLLISEDLDELLTLADRMAVMSEGRIVFTTDAANAERQVLGAHMGGGHTEPMTQLAA